MLSPDIVIITALPVERDAVLRHLDSHTLENNYFRGQIQAQNVVVALTSEMGNVEAAIVATQMLESLEPRHIIMLGIAAGVPDRVALGDVVVAKFCHYYELAKLKTQEKQRRIRQYPCSTELYGSARNYQGADWHKTIKAVLPQQKISHLPQVHFGPIASGEKIIADEVSVARLVKDCPELLAVAMEGAGVARAVQHKEGTHFIEIRGISDFADPQKNDEWQAYAANAAAAFLMAWLRSWAKQASGKQKGVAHPTLAEPTVQQHAEKIYNMRKIKKARFE
jgi:5'-methylthioadenosine/S-adenosylhomocysteine nucleosidase